MHVLVTGGSGFIGSEIIRDLIDRPEVTSVVMLVRPKDGQSPEQRFEKIANYWKRFGLGHLKGISKVKIVASLPDPCSPEGIEISCVFHCAAITEFDQTIAQCRRANVFLTQDVCRWAGKLPALKRFVHFSTAFVSGTMKGIIPLDHRNDGFNNTYEQTKFESERVVIWSGLPYTILRPTIVVGDSRTGYVYRMRVLYSVWRILLTGHLPRTPVDLRSGVDLVPVDYVVRAAIFLGASEAGLNRVFHLAAGRELVTPHQILSIAHQIFQLPMPRIAPPFVAKILVMGWIQRFLPHELQQIVERMRWHLPYLGTKGRIFDTSATQAALQGSGIRAPEFKNFGPRLFEFCKKSNWGKVGYVLD